MSYFVTIPATVFRNFDSSALSGAKESRKEANSFQDLMVSQSTEGSMENIGNNKRIQPFLDNLLQTMLTKPKTLQLAFLKEKRLFQSHSFSRFIVIFLWKSKTKTTFEAYFLDFASRRWLGLERLEKRNQTKVLIDLTEYLKTFPRDSVFLLFEEFLLMRSEELISLKLSMKDNNLVYIEFCARNVKPNEGFIREGDTEMKPRSDIFYRVKSNQEMDSGFLGELANLDFVFRGLKKLGKKIGEIRTNLSSLKNRNLVEILTAGLGNFQQINCEKLKFSLFLENVKEMCRASSSVLSKKSRLSVKMLKVEKKITKGTKKAKRRLLRLF